MKEFIYGESKQKSIHKESTYKKVHTGETHIGRAHLEEYI